MTGDRELDALLEGVPDHVQTKLAEVNRQIASSPQQARWTAVGISMHASAFENSPHAGDAEAARAIKKAAQYLITKAKNS